MTFRAPPDPKTHRSLHLSCLDQNTMRVYTQTVQIFPFPDSTQKDAALGVLQDAFRVTLEEFPFLAGELNSSDDNSGRLFLTYPIVISRATVNKLLTDRSMPKNEDFPWSYEELRDHGMPPSVFTSARFSPNCLAQCPSVPPNGEGIVDFSQGPVPALGVHATFIPGGLVLTFSVHHSVMDCYGTYRFWSRFSSNTLQASKFFKMGKTITPVQRRTLDLSGLRLQLDERVSKLTSGQRLTAEAYVDGKYVYPSTFDREPICAQRYFVFSAARVSAFRDKLRRQFSEGSAPSIFNVLFALIWIHVTRARAARFGSDGVTNAGIAVDLRKKLDPPLSEDYMGNMAIFAKGTYSIAGFTKDERVTDATIVETIKVIKNTVAKVDDGWAMHHLGFFNNIERIEDNECALSFRFGRDIYITSWMNFGADLKWGIPGTDLNPTSLDGRPEFIRRTYNPSDGGMMIMPRRRGLLNGAEAPYEVMIRLAAEDMARLEAEEGGLASWTERVLI